VGKSISCWCKIFATKQWRTKICAKNSSISFLWSPYGIGRDHYIFAMWFFLLLFSSFFFLSSPNLSRRRLDICHTSTHGVAFCANLRCRSETCCTPLAGNAGPKKVAKNRHLGTIAQFCQAISSQLRHASTIGKTPLSSNMSSRFPHNMVNFGPLAAEIGLPVWGTPSNFNGFRVLATLLHESQVVGVSQTLRRWTEGATYVRQGDHHVGHWPTF